MYPPIFKKDSAKGAFFGLFAAVTFGFLPFFSIPLMENAGLQVSSLLFYRFVFAGVVMTVIVLIRKVNLRITLRQFFILAFLAGLYVASGTALVHSYLYIPSGVATTIHFMYPVVVTATMIFFFKERKSKTIFTAMFMAISGVALLCWTPEGTLDMRGVWWAGSTILWYAAYLIIVNRSSVSSLDSLTMMFYIFLLGSALFAATTLAEGGLQPLDTAFEWKMIAAVAILSTVIPNIALLKAVKHSGPVVTSILGSAEPLTAMVVGILYFGEGFSPRTSVGFVLVVGAVVLVILNKNRENNPFVRLNKYFSLQKQKGNLKT